MPDVVFPPYMIPEERAERIGEVALVWPFRDEILKVVNVVILGTPNAGKSNLVNCLVDEKISAVSPKRNTTRVQNLGVLTKHNTQMVLYDTPGVLEMAQAKRYEKDLTKAAWDSAREAHVAMVVVDAVKRVGIAEKNLIIKASEWSTATGRPCILVLNKMDLVKPKRAAVELADQLLELCDFNEVFYVSAHQNKFVDDVQAYLLESAVEGAWAFSRGETTDMSDKDRVHEVIREKIFCRLNQEIPYGITQETRGWMDLPNGGVRVTQQLYVQSANQQGILIGKQGAVLSIITREAIKDLEAVLLRPVELNLQVTVR